MGKEARPRLGRTYSSCGYFLACPSQGKPQSAWVAWPKNFIGCCPKGLFYGLALVACALSQQVFNISCSSKFLLSTLSLALTHSFSYRPSNIPSRCCRAFHTSLWNKHGNVLKAVFYPFCASSKSATYKLRQNLLPALLQ